jgi:hypothetical protein
MRATYVDSAAGATLLLKNSTLATFDNTSSIIND